MPLWIPWYPIRLVLMLYSFYQLIYFHETWMAFLKNLTCQISHWSDFMTLRKKPNTTQEYGDRDTLCSLRKPNQKISNTVLKRLSWTLNFYNILQNMNIVHSHKQVRLRLPVQLPIQFMFMVSFHIVTKDSITAYGYNI